MFEYCQQCRRGLYDAVRLLESGNEMILSFPPALTKDLLRWRSIDIGHLFMCLGNAESEEYKYDENGNLMLG